MKMMSDKKMDMRGGSVKSAPYFPEMPEHRVLAKSGEIRNQKYPDKEQEIHADQNQFVRAANAGANKPDFRH